MGAIYIQFSNNVRADSVTVQHNMCSVSEFIEQVDTIRKANRGNRRVDCHCNETLAMLSRAMKLGRQTDEHFPELLEAMITDLQYRVQRTVQGYSRTTAIDYNLAENNSAVGIFPVRLGR